jgi:hypothetical protein
MEGTLKWQERWSCLIPRQTNAVGTNMMKFAGQELETCRTSRAIVSLLIVYQLRNNMFKRRAIYPRDIFYKLKHEPQILL